jgi:hypothetical protein
MKKVLLSAVLLLVLAGCASVSKVDTGEQAVGERLVVSLEGPWNRVEAAGQGPAQVWTMEGLPVDQLLVYSGIKDEERVHAGGQAAGARKDFAFRSTMEPHQIVAMFEGMLTRDGSQFTLVKLEPSGFGGGKGFRFEYSVIRRADHAQLSGVGFGTVSKGELFALLYHAPRLTFFPRHAARVEQIARSARVKAAGI